MSKAHLKNANIISIYYDVIISHLGKRSASRLRHQMNFLYEDLELDAVRVLDIGGGNAALLLHIQDRPNKQRTRLYMIRCESHREALKSILET